MKKASALVLAGVIAMSLVGTAFASNFTPSVVQKEAPEVVAVTDKDGNEVAAVIKDENGNELASIPKEDLVVTPVSKAEELPVEIKEKVEKATEQIKKAANLVELAPELKTHVENIAPEVKTSDLVVRDLFDVTLDSKHEEALSNGGITINFAVNLKPTDLLVVMHNYADDLWEVIPNDRVVRNADGSVGVTFTSLSPVAFVVDATQVAVDPEGPTSPQTGEETPVYAVMGMALCAVAAAYFVVNSKKKA